MFRPGGNGGDGRSWSKEARSLALAKQASYRMAAGSGLGSARDYPPSVTTKVEDVTRYPFSTVGRLFFRQGGQAYWGTACVIGRRGVYTAARNLWDKGAASTDVEFWLQYEGGKSLGKWEPDPGAIYYPEGWKTQGTASFDYAVFKTSADLPVDRIGELPFGASAAVARGTPLTAIGYPGGPFDPEWMWQCQGALDSALPFLSLMQNRMAEGSGGGPWTMEAGGAARIIGSMGQLIPEYDLASSPPFDANVEQYFQKIKN